MENIAVLHLNAFWHHIASNPDCVRTVCQSLVRAFNCMFRAPETENIEVPLKSQKFSSIQPEHQKIKPEENPQDLKSTTDRPDGQIKLMHCLKTRSTISLASYWSHNNISLFCSDFRFPHNEGNQMPTYSMRKQVTYIAQTNSKLLASLFVSLQACKICINNSINHASVNCGAPDKNQLQTLFFQRSLHSRLPLLAIPSSIFHSFMIPQWFPNPSRGHI